VSDGRGGRPTYKQANCFERAHFPDGWRGEGIEFLAEFVSDHFGARLMVEEQSEYPYVLFAKAGDSE
jgi:hypothetical protein